MKTSSRALPGHFEAGLKPDKSKKNRLDPFSLVKIGVVSCLLLAAAAAAAEYYIMYGDQIVHDIAT